MPFSIGKGLPASSLKYLNDWVQVHQGCRVSAIPTPEKLGPEWQPVAGVRGTFVSEEGELLNVLAAFDGVISLHVKPMKGKIFPVTGPVAEMVCLPSMEVIEE